MKKILFLLICLLPFWGCQEQERYEIMFISPNPGEVLHYALNHKSEFISPTFKTHIWITDVKGKHQRKIEGDYDVIMDIQISPDGRKTIINQSMRKKGKEGFWTDAESGTWIMDIDGKNFEKIAEGGFYSWLTDEKIILSGKDDEIYIMDIRERKPIKLNLPKKGGGLRVSSDGSKILFCSYYNEKHNPDIYMVDIDGKNLINLTNSESKERFPCFSPDGKKIAFVSNKDRKLGNIWIMDLEERTHRRLTKFGDDGFIFPSNIGWSPDGKKIIFQVIGGKPKKGLIYIINTDGTGLKKLAEGVSPSWLPILKK